MSFSDKWCKAGNKTPTSPAYIFHKINIYIFEFVSFLATTIMPTIGDVIKNLSHKFIVIYGQLEAVKIEKPNIFWLLSL